MAAIKSIVGLKQLQMLRVVLQDDHELGALVECVQDLQTFDELTLEVVLPLHSLVSCVGLMQLLRLSGLSVLKLEVHSWSLNISVAAAEVLLTGLARIDNVSICVSYNLHERFNEAEQQVKDSSLSLPEEVELKFWEETL